MEDKTMKKKTYIQPVIENVIAMELMEMREGSWGVDGQHQPIDEAGGDEIDVLGKEGSNMWDGWDE